MPLNNTLIGVIFVTPITKPEVEEGANLHIETTEFHTLEEVEETKYVDC